MLSLFLFISRSLSNSSDSALLLGLVAVTTGAVYYDRQLQYYVRFIFTDYPFPVVLRLPLLLDSLWLCRLLLVLRINRPTFVLHATNFKVTVEIIHLLLVSVQVVVLGLQIHQSKHLSNPPVFVLGKHLFTCGSISSNFHTSSKHP